MARSAIVLNKAAITELLQGPRGDVVKDLTRRTLKVNAGAKRRCPVDHGRLRSSIRHSLRKDSLGYYGYVGTDVDYALAVHNGTRSHQVGSTRGPGTAIKFKAGGQDIFISFPATVTIPARPARPFLKDALQDART